MAQLVFQNFGGVDQLVLQGPADLDQVLTLEPARWAATSVPCAQLFADPAVLAYLDTDRNGRIRVEEVCAAIRLVKAQLSDLSRMDGGHEDLLVASIRQGDPEATKVRALAERLLAQEAAGDRSRITLAQVRAARTSYTSAFPNGDGVVVEGQASDPEVAGLIASVVTVTGGTPDVSGAQGASMAQLSAWQDAVRSFSAWKARASGEAAATVLPFGDATAGVAGLVQDLSPKIAQYFAQCHLVSQEAGAQARMQSSAEELAALNVRDPGAIDAWLSAAPLATPRPGAVLPLDGPINPKFAAALGRLAAEVLPRALGREGTVLSLTEGDWAAVLAFVQPYLAWRADRPASIAEDADAAALLALANGPVPAKLGELCAKDASVAEEVRQFDNLERLVLYQRWLYPLVNNMVSFPDLFDGKKQALFVAGTLVLDGCRLALCTRVADRGAHKGIAVGSRMFIAYAELHRRDAAGAAHTDLVAAAVTAGQQGGIAVGKRGIFYDRDHVEWDATIVEVVKEPISIVEAAWAPIEKARDMIAQRFEQFVGSKQTAMEGNALGVASGAAPVPGATPPPAGGDAGGMQQLVLTGSVAFAAVGTTLTYVVQTLSGMSIVQVLASVGGLVGGLMAVSGFLGWLRLRKRDLSTYIEAGAWALNGRMYLNTRLANGFTDRPAVPSGSEVRADPDAWKFKVVVGILVLLALAVGYYLMLNPEILSPPAPETPAEAPAEAAAPAP